MKILKFSASMLFLSSIIFISVPLSPVLANEVQKILFIADKGSQSRPTTITKAELTIQIQAETSAQVQAAIISQSNSLVDYLRSQGVDQPKSQGLQIKPNQDNQGRTESYTGNNTISFRYAGDYGQVKQILDKAIEETKASRGNDWFGSSSFYEIVTSEDNP